VESILVSHPAVTEAAAIGVPDPVKGESLVCYCVLKPGHTPDEALRVELKKRVADALGKPFGPNEVKFVRDLPKTRNAKIMRRVIRATYLGRDPGDVSSMENPSAVEELRRAL
jgi:acetyl-CoA synthetase